MLVVLCALLCVTRLAHADDATARTLFREGVDLFDKKDYAAALQKFKAAYREKQSAGIKQNIGLCHKGLGEFVEATTAFDEALDEGQGTLKPDTKAAIKRELAELSTSVATVYIKVFDAEDMEEGQTAKSIETAIVTVDTVQLPPGAVRRPVRLKDGIHTFAARVDGYTVPPEKKLALILGQPVEATFIVSRGPATGQGTLSIHASLEDAVIVLDGKEVGKGDWSGKIGAGNHKIEVKKEGYATTTVDVPVPAGASVDYPIELRRRGQAPALYDPETRRPIKEKRAYVVANLGLSTGTLRLTQAAGEIDASTRRFTFPGLGLRGGYKFTRAFAIELHVELGGAKDSYSVRPSEPDVEASISHVQLTAMMRYMSLGHVRFMIGSGLGPSITTVETKFQKVTSSGAGTQTIKGSGFAFAWLLDLGMQFDVGPIFIEPALFVDVYGVGPTRDPGTTDRLLRSSPAARYGARFGLGFPF